MLFTCLKISSLTVVCGCQVKLPLHGWELEEDHLPDDLATARKAKRGATSLEFLESKQEKLDSDLAAKGVKRSLTQLYTPPSATGSEAAAIDSEKKAKVEEEPSTEPQVHPSSLSHCLPLSLSLCVCVSVCVCCRARV